MNLTKDTDKILCLIYEEFLNRKKSGLSKSDSIRFDDPASLQTQFLQGILEDDIYDAVTELKNCKFVHAYIDDSFELTSSGIIYMENRFKKGLKELLSYISLIK